MPAGLSIARWFCFAGGALALGGLVLRLLLPISMSVPPYLCTALLAIAYGLFCWKKSHRPASAKEEPRE